MALTEVSASAIEPALALLPPKMDSAPARVMLLSIGLQESRFVFRRQMGDGPARGFWQFERGGGAKGVCRHAASRELMEQVCIARRCPFTPEDLWRRIEFDDVLAAAAARLLLWTDPYALPAAFNDHEAAWRLYERVWRPGKPHRHTWDGFHVQAVRFVTNQGDSA